MNSSPFFCFGTSCCFAMHHEQIIVFIIVRASRHPFQADSPESLQNSRIIKWGCKHCFLLDQLRIMFSLFKLSTGTLLCHPFIFCCTDRDFSSALQVCYLSVLCRVYTSFSPRGKISSIAAILNLRSREHSNMLQHSHAMSYYFFGSRKMSSTSRMSFITGSWLSWMNLSTFLALTLREKVLAL